mmetsp:Transcript_14327/g.20939  ORF Transcript_14327/g.20939 Transcript_14327/m.20939 type:complete len:116 (+) Transcript_14327:24-371(+)
MAYPPTTLEEAFRQEVDLVADTEDIQFAKKHFLFVNKHRCKQGDKPEACITEGQETFKQFVNGLKSARQRAFYCMNECSEDSCYNSCVQSLSEKVNSLYSPISPVINDYLLQFAK